jgi:hypothetical protein
MRDRLYICGADVALTALGGRWRTIVLAAPPHIHSTVCASHKRMLVEKNER